MIADTATEPEMRAIASAEIPVLEAKRLALEQEIRTALLPKDAGKYHTMLLTHEIDPNWLEKVGKLPGKGWKDFVKKKGAEVEKMRAQIQQQQAGTPEAAPKP